MPRFTAFAVIMLVLIAFPAQAAGDFNAWLQNLRQEALQKGISQKTVSTALSDIQPISRVIELDRKQPEGTMSFAQYKQRVISQDRIDKGRELYNLHRNELNRVAAQYGVPAQYIVALWGIETSYGENTGGFETIEALATLAYDGRRSGYFRTELFNALHILDEGHISYANMKGSWAGAMGQNQFMPSSFKAFAVDGNGDGKRNIWTSLPDVFASTANYLSKSGWRSDQRWGRQVVLPRNFPVSLTGIDNARLLKDWQGMGVSLPGNQPLPTQESTVASIVLPDGINGPAFLVYENYRVIMKWNKSKYFATSVGLLADGIAQ